MIFIYIEVDDNSDTKDKIEDSQINQPRFKSLPEKPNFKNWKNNKDKNDDKNDEKSVFKSKNDRGRPNMNLLEDNKSVTQNDDSCNISNFDKWSETQFEVDKSSIVPKFLNEDERRKHLEEERILLQNQLKLEIMKNQGKENLGKNKEDNPFEPAL